jgi:D-3-phosphoglycerate dehydrogenase
MAEKPRRSTGARFRVLVSDPVAEAGLALLRSCPEFNVDVRLKLAPDELKKALAGADALVIRSETKVTADVLETAKSLKIIGRAGVGVDNVDVAAATRRGVLVTNAPEGNTIAAAEHAVALLLSLTRNVPAANASMRAGEWKRSKFVGHELFGKTLGLVGLGRIGREVAKRALAFGMNVVGCDPLIAADKAREAGVTLVDIRSLLKRADYISLHATLNPDTRHMIGKKEFAIMKKGVRLVNCARGGLIDEAALAVAVKSGQVGGVALDVFETEPPAKDNPLLGMENVVLTPHLGASTEEAQVAVSVVVAEQVRDYLLKGLVRNAVNAPTAAPETMSEMAPYMDLAERMGRFLIQLVAGSPKRLELEYSGEITRRNVAMLTAAAVKGALSMALSERVNEVNALALAKDRGIGVSEGTVSTVGEFSTLIRLVVVTDRESRSVEGTVIGKDEPHIVAVDGLHLDIVPKGVMITFSNVDRPGIVGKVGTILGRNRINIAGLHLGRMAVGKRSVSVFSVDDPVPAKVLVELAELAELSDVKVVTI